MLQKENVSLTLRKTERCTHPEYARPHRKRDTKVGGNTEGAPNNHTLTTHMQDDRTKAGGGNPCRGPTSKQTRREEATKRRKEILSSEVSTHFAACNKLAMRETTP